MRRSTPRGGSRWSNVKGTAYTALIKYDGIWTPEGKFPPDLAMLLSELAKQHSPTADECHIVIGFVSSGYYDPGRTTGPVDGSYPPEGEDNREITSIEINFFIGTPHYDGGDPISIDGMFLLDKWHGYLNDVVEECELPE